MSTISSRDTRSPQLTAAAAPPLLAPPQSRWPTRILVCAHDSASTGDALAATRALAVRSQAEVDVLTVFGPRIPVPEVSDKRGSARCETRDRGAVAELIRAVRSEERERFDGRAPWPVHLEVGSTVKVIADSARQTSADLVVVGLGSRDPFVRNAGVAIPASLARYVEVPMLAAAPMLTALPQQAVLFVDRDAPNPAMISVALRSVEAAAFVWVLMFAGTTAHSGDGVKHDKNTLAGIMKMIRREARAISKGIVVRALYRSGEPVDAILSLARDVNADLIVTPVHGTAGAVRSLVPNIADRLLLTAPCSVLVVPDA
jgi:nucleotide-binding universal stress UspA family protein